MKNLNTLSETLENTKKSCVGLFRSNVDEGWRPVIEDNNGKLKIISIGKFFDLYISYRNKNEGEYVQIKAGQTLRESIPRYQNLKYGIQERSDSTI